jgi:serine/threonine-protein kinase
MQVPEWMLRMIYKCLEKKPENRFVNGTELHNYITYHSSSPAVHNRVATEALDSLQKENEKLRREKWSLEQTLLQYQKSGSPMAAYPPAAMEKKKGMSSLLWFLLVALVIGAISYTLLKNNPDQPVQNTADTSSSEPVKPRVVIGQFKVQVPRAYFHNEPDAATKRNAYMVPSNDIVAVLDEKNNFVYTEFTNNKGQTSKGWLKKSDLISMDEWNRRDSAQQAIRLKQEDINSQLAEARNFLQKNEIREALYIYDYLVQQGVPEAMYQWGNLALQRKNDAISCNEGWGWIERASNKGYVPAKRTLGFLYMVADNDAILQLNEYDKCQYERNVYKGSKLLTEAMLAGDTTAQRILEEFNTSKTDSSGR